MPFPGSGIAISSLSVSPATCAVGSEDGYLRLWPLDFSSVLLEAGETEDIYLSWLGEGGVLWLWF